VKEENSLYFFSRLEKRYDVQKRKKSCIHERRTSSINMNIIKIQLWEHVQQHSSYIVFSWAFQFICEYFPFATEKGRKNWKNISHAIFFLFNISLWNHFSFSSCLRGKLFFLMDCPVHSVEWFEWRGIFFRRGWIWKINGGFCEGVFEGVFEDFGGFSPMNFDEFLMKF
jgi:hypothetical protein